MGSDAHVVVADAPPELLDWAEAEVHRLEAQWSRFLADSALCGLNAAAGSGPVATDPLLVLAVERSLELGAATAGRFDPTVLASLVALGYDRTFREVDPDAPGDVVGIGPARGPAGIVVDRAAATVELPAGVALDLGGIGKGLAADLVATGLLERGAGGAAVGLGGDVRVAGLAPGGSEA